MIGWFGDGNSYVGNLDLKPETAYSLSGTWEWSEGSRKQWDLKVTPYYSYVRDYIDVNNLGPQNGWAPGSPWSVLQFANHDAQLWGVNVSGNAPLWSSAAYGDFGVKGKAGWVEGKRLDGVNLYHMMPLNGQFALTNRFGNWSSAIEVQAVGAKDQVDAMRWEPATPAYALVNLRTSYTWENVRFDFAVENLLDKFYYQPLGGTDYLASWYGPSAYTSAWAPVPVMGMGRSFNFGVTVKF
jgi:iron complex outermembrane receptor protein